LLRPYVAERSNVEVFLENMVGRLVGLANEVHAVSNYGAQLITRSIISIRRAPANLRAI